MTTSTIPRLSAADVLTVLHKKRSSLPFYCMYSSFLGGIVDQPALMVLPLDDHMCHRGHAVFDTTGIDRGVLYNCSQHVDRLLRSAAAARISHSFSREWIIDTICQTAKAAGRPFAAIRFWISAGPGDFGLSPAGCTEPCFVCVVTAYFPIPALPIREVTVRSSKVGMKGYPLATTKSVGYLPNILLHLEAKDRGGVYGVWIGDDGNAKEGPIDSLVVVKNNSVFSPPPRDVLASCTAARVLELAPTLGCAAAEFRDIPAVELYDADELFLVGGDTHFFCIRELDGRAIGCFRENPDLQDAPAESFFARVRAAMRTESVEAGRSNTIDLGLRE
jgi:4-amino-4-deoxychorismate lyase